MKLTGTWAGQYTYGLSYEELAGRSVPFTMSLTESWLRRVAGYVRDDSSRGGQPERGRVLGRRRGDKVEFVKTMPVGYVVDEDGNMVETKRFLEEVCEVELPQNLPPHRILYIGVLDGTGEALAGQWRIVPWGKTDDGQELGGGEGTWTARRTSYEPSAV